MGWDVLLKVWVSHLKLGVWQPVFMFNKYYKPDFCGRAKAGSKKITVKYVVYSLLEA